MANTFKFRSLQVKSATIVGGPLTLTGGTVTESAPLISATQTWNNAAVTFTGLQFVVTNTASNAASLVARFAVGSSNVVETNVRGMTTFRRLGSSDFSNIVEFRRETTLLASIRDDGGFSFSNNCTGAGCTMHNEQVRVGSGGAFGFTNASFNAFGTTDIFLRRDAAGVLAQYNGSNPQAYNIYNTFTSATNHERGFLKWNANVFQIGTEKGSGGGSARALEFQTDGVTRVNIAAGGNVGIRTTSAPTHALQIAGNCDQNAIGPLVITPSSTPNQIGCALTLGAGNLSGARNYSFISTGPEAAGGAGDFAIFSGGYVFRCNNNGQYLAGFNTYSYLAQISCYPFSASTKGLVVRGFASQTANLFECQDSAASVLASISSAGAGVFASLTLNGNLTLSTRDIVTDTTTGTKIGTGTTQKIGFFNKTPVVQPTAVADATDAATVITQLNALLSRMRDLGLIAT